jgi:hypothetical protein
MDMPPPPVPQYNVAQWQPPANLVMRTPVDDPSNNNNKDIPDMHSKLLGNNEQSSPTSDMENVDEETPGRTSVDICDHLSNNNINNNDNMPDADSKKLPGNNEHTLSAWKADEKMTPNLVSIQDEESNHDDKSEASTDEEDMTPTTRPPPHRILSLLLQQDLKSTMVSTTITPNIPPVRFGKAVVKQQ